MPQKNGNSVSMTEEEAKKFMQDLNLDGPDSSSTNTQQSSGGSGSQKGSGWWEEPIKHALARHGIQTTIDGKDVYDDYGSVYEPSKKFNKKFKNVLKNMDSSELKEVLKGLLEDSENYEDIENDIELFIEDTIGAIKYKYKSQKERGQLVNGNFQITEEEYKKLKKLNNIVNKDFKKIETWRDELQTNFESRKKEAKSKLQEFEEKLKSKTNDPKKFKVKIKQKIDEFITTLNQYRADVKYADKIVEIVDGKKGDVESLYDNAMKKSGE